MGSLLVSLEIPADFPFRGPCPPPPRIPGYVPVLTLLLSTLCLLESKCESVRWISEKVRQNITGRTFCSRDRNGNTSEQCGQ